MIDFGSNRSSAYFVAIMLITILGCASVVYGMKWGPWAGSDSVAYIEAARNFAKGDGLVIRQASGDRVPLSLHPPLYPVLLAALSVFSSDMIFVAKIANVVLWGIFILSICLFYYFYLDHPIYLFLVCFLFLSSPLFLRLFTGAMSEPLFFVTSLMSLLLIIIYLQTNKAMVLFLSALLAAMSLLTRYMGVAVIAAGVLGLLVFSLGGFLKRVGKSVAYLAIGVSPLFVWTINLSHYGEYLGFLDFNFRDLWTRLAPYKVAFMDILWRWMKFDLVLSDLDYDNKLNILLVLIVVTLLVPIIALIISKRKVKFLDLLKLASLRFSVIAFSFSILFVIFTALAVPISTRHYDVPNERIMSPFLMAIFVGSSSGVVFLLELFPSSRLSKFILPLFYVAFITLQIGPGFSYLRDLHDHGYGYTDKAWQSSELIEKVEELPLDTSIISNEADAILLHVNRPAYRIPELEQRKKVAVFDSFGQDYEDKIQQIFRENGAALVLFDTVYWQFVPIYYHKTEERLEAFTSGLYLFSEAADGEIYFYEFP
jgi:hypothetical protein